MKDKQVITGERGKNEEGLEKHCDIECLQKGKTTEPSDQQKEAAKVFPQLHGGEGKPWQGTFGRDGGRLGFRGGKTPMKKEIDQSTSEDAVTIKKASVITKKRPTSGMGAKTVLELAARLEARGNHPTPKRPTPRGENKKGETTC